MGLLHVISWLCVCVLVTQSCLTVFNPIDYSAPGSSVHGILQARILEWVAIPFSRGSSWHRNWTQVSCIAGKFLTIWATREIPISWLPGTWYTISCGMNVVHHSYVLRPVCRKVYNFVFCSQVLRLMNGACHLPKPTHINLSKNGNMLKRYSDPGRGLTDLMGLISNQSILKEINPDYPSIIHYPFS